MKNNKDPEILWHGKWTPICGHYFWDNNNGAKLFCQILGYTNGKVKGRYYNPRHELTDDAIMIGKCSDSDKDLFSPEIGFGFSGGFSGGFSDTIGGCTGGCNDLKVGEYCKTKSNTKWAYCTKGEPAKIEIECYSNGKLTILLIFDFLCINKNNECKTFGENALMYYAI